MRARLPCHRQLGHSDLRRSVCSPLCRRGSQIAAVASRNSSSEVFIVHDASSDDSPDSQGAFPLVRLKENTRIGFVRANNQASTWSTASTPASYSDTSASGRSPHCLTHGEYPITSLNAHARIYRDLLTSCPRMR